MLSLGLDLPSVAVRGGVPLWPVGSRIAVFGDSRTAGHFTSSGTVLENAKYGDRAIAGTRGRVTLWGADDYGVGGDTTTMMLARIGSVLASPARIVLFLGGTNDRGSANLSLATSQANVTSIVGQLVGAGKSVVIMSEIPRFSPQDLSGQQLQNHLDFHAWIPTLKSGRVAIAECWDQMIASEYIDGLHPLVQGQHRMGQAFADALMTLIGQDDVIALASGRNKVVNAGMTGTGGTKSGSGVSGSVADSYVFSQSTTNAGTIAIACSKVSSGGKTWQQFVLSGTPTGANAPELRQDVSLATAGFAVGDTVEAYVEFELDSASQFPGFPLRLRGLQSDGSTSTGQVEHGDFDGTNAGAYVAAGPYTGVRRTQPFTIPALTDRLRISVLLQCLGTTVAATVRFTNFTLVKV